MDPRIHAGGYSHHMYVSKKHEESSVSICTDARFALMSHRFKCVKGHPFFTGQRKEVKKTQKKRKRVAKSEVMCINLVLGGI